MLQFLALLALDLAGLVFLWFLLRARIRRYLELENLLGGVREEARALVTELNETADRNVSLVEDRIVALRSLLDEVDRRMGIARRELESREAERLVFERLRRQRPMVPQEGDALSPIAPDKPLAVPSRPARSLPGESRPDRPAEKREAEPIPLALRGGYAPDAAAPRVPSPASVRVPEVILSTDPIKPARVLRDEALDLYRKGFSADIIAARLGATVAEIELIVEIGERRVERE
jgi:hypothetical protein